jgi:hypothetical protein
VWVGEAWWVVGFADQLRTTDLHWVGDQLRTTRSRAPMLWTMGISSWLFHAHLFGARGKLETHRN